ncbi:MAG: efflux RND transporter periplasmic adaptor subunit, partial [bacterium]|nr:efflux RND transporter periplasmic adaptor subunit [bacterium]
DEEIERVKDQHLKARNAFRLAQLELETLETRSNIQRSSGAIPETGQKLDDVRVLAPTSGIVIGRPVELGEVVVSGILSTVTGTVMYEIGDPSQMMVKARISEVDVGRLKPGQKVQIIVDAYPDTTYLGEVHRIAPVGQIPPGGSIVSFETDIRMLNPEPRLRQGMSCDIDIIFARQDSTTYLPIEALYEDFGEDARTDDKKGMRGRFLAYLKTGSDFVETEVEVGLKSDTRLEVLSNLAPGDSVAVNAEKIFQKQKKEKASEKDEK